ncbi:MAG: hypothetical protein LBK69_02790 [Syntrophomonadaceae bacterium]|jgi:hypothetical protein|nr:hypothetical protein [Syntrophomonadaceae bacterium]
MILLNCKVFWIFSKREALKDSEGYLLIELLVALPLMIMVAAALWSILWLGLNVYRQHENKSEIQYFCRTALQFIQDDVKKGETLALAEESNDLQITDMNGELIVYYLMNGRVYRRSTGASPQPVCEGIGALSFELAANGLVRVVITGVKGAETCEMELVCGSSLLSAR